MITEFRKAIIVFLGLIVASGAFMLITSKYYKREYFEFVKSVWNMDETYVFLQTSIVVERIPAWKILFAKVTGRWLGNESYKRSHLTVYHRTGDSSKISSQRNFDMRGQLVIVHGVPHLIQGGYEISGFRWTGSEFEQLSKDATEEIRALLKADKAFWLKQGWQKLDWEELGNLGNNCDKVFPVASPSTRSQLHIQILPAPLNRGEQILRNPRVHIEISVDEKWRTLIDLTQDYERIQRREFIEIRKRSHSPISPRTSPTPRLAFGFRIS